jgi:hypothetical protein
MAKRSDWVPGTRTAQIAMIRVWLNIMSPADVRTAWGIPLDRFTALGTLFSAAQALLQKAETTERNQVITEQCREAFEALIEEARFFKGHYFLVPPLTRSDLIDLGLKPRGKPSPTGTPTAEARVETYLVGPHQLGFRIVYVSGDPDDRANEGYRIWYKIVPPGGEPVTNPKQLTESFFTRRWRDLKEFDYTDSGKTIYIAVQIENGGRKGPWGPIVSAIIP